MIVSFKFYVMNFVDFVIDCYLHITSHVSQAFASCTHYTSYSLLNIVHVIVCVFGLTNQVCKYFECLYLGKLGFNSCFWKSYHHILMHCVPKFLCFEMFLKLFKKLCFSQNFCESLSVSIDRVCFLINRNYF